MHTHDEAIPTQLIRDLFNPALTAFDLCDRHGLTLDRLADLLESPAMDRVAARLDAITRRRTELLAPRARLAALGRLAELAAAVPEDRRHAEAVRRAAVEAEQRAGVPVFGVNVDCFKPGGLLTDQYALVSSLGEKAVIEGCRRAGIVPPAWLTGGKR